MFLFFLIRDHVQWIRINISCRMHVLRPPDLDYKPESIKKHDFTICTIYVFCFNRRHVFCCNRRHILLQQKASSFATAGIGLAKSDVFPQFKYLGNSDWGNSKFVTSLAFWTVWVAICMACLCASQNFWGTFTAGTTQTGSSLSQEILGMPTEGIQTKSSSSYQYWSARRTRTPTAVSCKYHGDRKPMA